MPNAMFLNMSMISLLISLISIDPSAEKTISAKRDGTRNLGTGPQTDYNQRPLSEPVTLTILYDNTSVSESFTGNWGFSCLVQGTQKTILFDTGTHAGILMRHFQKLDIDPSSVDIIVISHEHGDHIGGLTEFLSRRNKIPVYYPHSFSETFVENVKRTGAFPKAVSDPVEICPQVYSSGEMGERIKEQALVIDSERGLIVITGCSHPGINRMLKKISTQANRNLYAVLGGFHLADRSHARMKTLIEEMKALGVQKCGATHCTGDEQIMQFKEAFGDDYLPMGAGRIFSLETSSGAPE